MKERFSIVEIYICPLIKVNEGTLKPDLNYPTRYCVIDKKNKIAIDIKTRLKYNYIETANNKHFLEDSYKKIMQNERVAIFPLIGLGYDKCDLILEACDIIKDLKKNKQFIDGNKFYNNKQYLESLKTEQFSKQNLKQSVNNKLKKMIKRKK